ncbi:MAG: NPCBM/NEW2 domain-containing protein [Verrucomicrobia bacterium]|nr:NPCBM/NEW2 domain-containing protein [Verrucomicrobiota bacterium]
MKNQILIAAIALMIGSFDNTGAIATAAAAETVPLTALDLKLMHQGWGQPQIDRSIREQPLAIAGRKFEHGVGTHARSVLWIQLDGGSERFRAHVGVDDAAGGPGSVVFRVLGDGRTLYESGLMKTNQAAREIDVDLRGVQSLLLQVDDGGDGVSYDHANWAEARFEVAGARPRSIEAPRETPYLLTPAPAPAPRINGPTVYGCRPGNPFIYRIPTTGERPMTFSAVGLPDTLRLDPQSGVVTGTAPARGDYTLTWQAQNRHGKASLKFRIRSGDTLALTPPMGWNHWYAHYNNITDAMARQAADLMVRHGLADVGYQYVSLDDCWMNAAKHADPLRVGPARDADGIILPNRHFPDMRALTDYIHSHGLKAGIYTSPGPTTCAGFTGSYQHEAQDARTFAEWGFDFLKYDWCSYGRLVKGQTGLEVFQKPFRQMGGILRQLPRDVVFNLCQYGMGNVWEWGAEVGGHCWRTAGDLGFELDRVFDVALKNAEHRAFSKPGAWNDPDYIQIGYIGAARVGGEPRYCPFTPSEQYSFMSLWCLMAAPLFYSGDMTRLDEFTLNVLANPEVIAVDQDPLGQCARVLPLEDANFAMVKDLEDGALAVGLFNRGEMPATLRIPWTMLGRTGPQHVRDLWRQTNLGVIEEAFDARIPRHGVALIRVEQPRPAPPR